MKTGKTSNDQYYQSVLKTNCSLDCTLCWYCLLKNKYWFCKTEALHAMSPESPAELKWRETKQQPLHGKTVQYLFQNKQIWIWSFTDIQNECAKVAKCVPCDNEKWYFMTVT